MYNDRLNTLFQRYINASCTEEEISELMQLISKHDSAETRDFLQHLWNNPAHTLPAEKAEKILQVILRSSESKPMEQRQRSFTWLKAAAVIVFTVLSGGLVYKLVSTEKQMQTVADIGEEKHRFIRLPDGSRVILNAGSTLDYPETFSDEEAREVYLTGEAFFDIRHDANKPFIVHTERINTTVLGTAFNVKAYPGQDNITVTVSRGKVRVSDEDKVLGIITPDQQIVVQKTSRKSLQHVVKSDEATAWTEKDIFFDDASMRDAVDELAQRFNVRIALENERIGNCRFTATFIRGEDLYQILDVICAFNGAQYSTDGSGNIRISGSGCTL